MAGYMFLVHYGNPMFHLLSVKSLVGGGLLFLFGTLTPYGLLISNGTLVDHGLLI